MSKRRELARRARELRRRCAQICKNTNPLKIIRVYEKLLDSGLLPEGWADREKFLLGSGRDEWVKLEDRRSYLDRTYKGVFRDLWDLWRRSVEGELYIAKNLAEGLDDMEYAEHVYTIDLLLKTAAKADRIRGICAQFTARKDIS